MLLQSFRDLFYLGAEKLQVKSQYHVPWNNSLFSPAHPTKSSLFISLSEGVSCSLRSRGARSSRYRAQTHAGNKCISPSNASRQDGRTLKVL